MRHLLAPLCVLVLASTARAADEWRPADARDVPGEVKKALIAESEKLAGDNEIGGFTYYQTPFDAKQAHFKAEFRAGGKQWSITCKPDGTIEKSESAAAEAGAGGDAPGGAAPKATPGPKAPEP